MDQTTPTNPIRDASEDVHIVHLDGGNKGQIEHFSSKPMTIGRHGKCDVALKNAALTVSRIHAKIIPKNGRFIFKSMGPNGSYINGRRIEQAPLKSGDIIQFSSSGPSIQFLFEKITDPSTLNDTLEYIPRNEKSIQSYKEFRKNNRTPLRNNVMRSYLHRSAQPSIYANLKSAFRKFKRSK